MNWGNFRRRARPPLQNQSCPFKRGPPERWPSGLRRTLGKRVCGKPYRGFESHSLRHDSQIATTLCHFDQFSSDGAQVARIIATADFQSWRIIERLLSVHAANGLAHDIPPPRRLSFEQIPDGTMLFRHPSLRRWQKVLVSRSGHIWHSVLVCFDPQWHYF
jgi:hypothetical protein